MGGPSRSASSASPTCGASRSASEYTPTETIPISLSVRMTRIAISPRLATRTFSNMARESIWRGTTSRAVRRLALDARHHAAGHQLDLASLLSQRPQIDAVATRLGVFGQQLCALLGRAD